MIEAWDNCLLGIKKGVSEEAFERWFKNTRPIFLNEKELFVEVPDSFCAETITNRFSSIIEEVVSLESSISGLRFVPSKVQRKLEAREEDGPEKIPIKP